MSRLLSLLALSACVPEVDVDALAVLSHQLQPGAERMVGEMPIVQAFDREVTRNEVELQDGEIRVHLDATDGDWVMLGGAVELDADDLPEGIWTTIDDRDHWIYGCSGPSDRRVWFDRDAQDVRVRKDTVPLDDGAVTVELSVVAGFGDDLLVGAVVRPVPVESSAGPADR